MEEGGGGWGEREGWDNFGGGGQQEEAREWERERRDEALRAMEIAERKFTMKDIMGAKRFALKAQALYPDLDGISQMLATLDIYIFAESKINGMNDWYSILCVSASANEEDLQDALQVPPTLPESQAALSELS
ncbi:hypothetical protein QJS10_CPB22g00506 [Acorus calamus]|uniref:Uncharacterized protein n=1 Tax=Acorus calamus TaxID=4465 RepID=A0AAV9C083_ACOCL|nr:hypothetical protein QJS10_CPB22g00506 [Acorus calamus]